MKPKYSFVLFFLFFSLEILAQDSFKPGYFITDAGEHVQCLINDSGWRSNPDAFEYKLDENAETKTAGIDDVVEFGLEDRVKFVKRTVQMDVVPTLFKNLTNNPNPEFKTETVFLKVLVEGTASLYSFARKESEIFLYMMEGEEIKQLVYKKFLINRSRTKLGYNTAYINELRENVSFYTDYFKEPDYTEKSLVAFFVQYNTDLGDPFTTYLKSRSAKIMLSPFAGIQKTNFNFDHVRDQYDRKADGNAYRFGVLLEYRIPYKNHRWAVLMEPSINFFEVTEQKEDWRNPVLVDAKRIELGFGVRHYVPVSENGSFFANFMIPFGLDRDTKIEPGYGDNKWTVNYLTTSVSGGVGFRLSRFSLEARYDHKRDLLPTNPNMKALLSGVSLNAGFAILN